MMNRLFTADFELRPASRKWAVALLLVCLLALAALCFLPQSIYPQLKSGETPGIIHVGRLVFLPLPFNSLVQLGWIPNLKDLAVILLQNVSNVFLLYPLVLLCLLLYPSWRSFRTVLLRGFLISLTIECGQLLLDFLFDANRVFETDDLLTNTLGACLAYQTYRLAAAFYQRKGRRP